MLLVGTDEAGYGPNLGPLVIAATVWEVDDSSPPPDLYELLDDTLTADPAGLTHRPARLPIADSKQLYRPGSGLAALERGVLALAGTLSERPGTATQLWQTLAPRAASPHDGPPCDQLPAAPALAVVPSEEIDDWTARLSARLAQAPARLRALRARAIFPADFNEQVSATGSKGEVLSRNTLELVADVLATCSPTRTSISCDKHGGRNHYLPLLQRQWPDDLIEVRGEGRTASCYRWGPAARRVEIEFRVGGEAGLPCALASMLAKYLRERAMEAFNQFWLGYHPTLRPTAGYPTDARRYFAAIAPTCRELGIPDSAVWRVK
ncbi:MAG: hypothetical protein U0935_18505 [Pirellulales bacterium]